MRFILGVMYFLLPLSAFAYTIDSVYVKSYKMNKEVPVIVVLPDNVQKEACPVIFLLHGYGGNQYSWLRIQPELYTMSDRDNVIIVCPDGENSWYWDSPIKKDSKYETFIAKELVYYIDKNYNTIKNKSGRAIAGLSMGGQGALWVSFRHPEIFGACGSMSGGVDLRPFPESWNVKDLIGQYLQNGDEWYRHAIKSQLDKIGNNDISIIIDCGLGDFFYEVNEDLHKELLIKGISHDYIVRQGIHNKEYWRNSIKYQWLFFVEFFKLKK